MYHVLRSMFYAGRAAPAPAGSARIARQRLHWVVQQSRRECANAHHELDLLRGLLHQECDHAPATYDA